MDSETALAPGNLSSDDVVLGGFMLDVEFEAPPGITILFGASGSGKTLTLKCVSGIVRPDSGRISIGGKALFDSGQSVDLPIRKRSVGYVFQNLALFPHLTVCENVEFGLSSFSRSERRARALAMLKAFRIEKTSGRKPRNISGGEAQRVALARALVCRPEILLLDEPLSAIDEATKQSIISDLKSINRELNLPIIYITHSREEAIALGERVIVYEQGRVVMRGEPFEVFRTPITTSVARLTGVENIFLGHIISVNEPGGTMTVVVSDEHGSCKIEAPFVMGLLGKQTKVGIPSGDILIASQEPRFTSARNILKGRILSIERKADRELLLVESGVRWYVSITRQAVEDLQLANGKEVWMAFKTHSCLLLDE